MNGHDEMVLRTIERALCGRSVPQTVREIQRRMSRGRALTLRAALHALREDGLVEVSTVGVGRRGRSAEVWKWIGSWITARP